MVKADVLRDEDAWANLNRPQCAGGLHLLLHVSGVCGADHHWVRALLQHEQFVAAADVYLDCAADGRRDGRALLAPPVPVVFCTFIIVHVYLAFYHDYIEGRGTISSIVGGWKFDREKPKDSEQIESKKQQTFWLTFFKRSILAE